MEMKTYKAIFSAAGPCTHIPDAQTLFGSFCQAILLLYGQEKLDEYLASFEAEPWFIHSSMFPDRFFPAPQKPLLTLETIQSRVNDQKTAAGKLAILSRLKPYKKIQYISQDVVKQFVLADNLQALPGFLKLNGGGLAVENEHGFSVLYDERKNQEVSFTVKTVLQTKSGTLQNKVEKDLFYQKQLFFSSSSRMAVYIKSSLPKESLETILKTIEITGCGPKISTGLNAFCLEELQDFELERKKKAASVFLLSPCIPKEGEFDLAASSYGIASSLYRASFSYVGDAFSGRFSALEEGSILKPVASAEYYGQLVYSQVKGKPIYHYGIGFVL